LRKGHWVIEARIAKIVMAGSLATFAFIVTFDNITDYYTNFEFVRHVLSMDTIFPGSTLLCRRVTCAALWNFAYWLIILGEGMTSLALGIAAVALFRHLTMELVDYARDVSHPQGLGCSPARRPRRSLQATARIVRSARRT
jgi:predicted small integral membrane protein